MQKQRCLNLLALIGFLAATRALGSVCGWMLFENSVRTGTVVYNVLFAAALWWAWSAVRRIPTR